jgi:6,7-dimethyl-8-ribityllumazine synthase
VRGAPAALRRRGVPPAAIRVHWVPGAFELPAAAARAVRQRPRPRAVIALGVLLRGETPQYTVIAQGVAQGLQQVAVQAVLPVTFGVIVAETMAQARARAGGARGNRGEEAAQAALDLLTLFEALG